MRTKRDVELTLTGNTARFVLQGASEKFRNHLEARVRDLMQATERETEGDRRPADKIYLSTQLADCHLAIMSLINHTATTFRRRRRTKALTPRALSQQ